MHSLYLMTLLLFRIAFGESDFDALLELKKGFQRDPSGLVFNSWNSRTLASDGCPKGWFGVTCVDGNVESIMLDSVGLVGKFDFSRISGLKSLRDISVPNNQLSGNVSGVGSIGSLEHLDISGNLFSGSVTSDLTDLSSLVHLNLSSNNLDGTIPSGFGNLKRLKYLDLHCNKFSGDIMDLISELGVVVQLDLSCNQFGGSLDIGLANSSFVSTIQYLNVSNNALVGELFSHDGMPYFDSLEVFDASGNQLHGTIPEFNFVVSLRVLRLGNNLLSGSIPEELLLDSSMILSELDISMNHLEGPVGSITSSTLAKLNLSSNKLSGLLPSKIGNCAIIDLSNNNFSGNLSRIQRWGNYVEVMNLSSNSLEGTLPAITSQFLKLTSFLASNNSVEGVLPPVIGTYPELAVIDLSFNQLTGFLLPSLFNSTTLTAIKLSSNNFSGPIPLRSDPSNSTGISQDLTLVSLDLSHNALTGHLPTQISRFHDLVYLDVSSNHFEGRIPGDLPDHLTHFNASYNNLSGVIPESLRRFPDMAFHPGNALLVFPADSPFSPGTIDRIPSGHHFRITHAIRVALIFTFVCAAVGLALPSLVLYYRSRRRERDGKSWKGSIGRKDNDCEAPPLPCKSPPKDSGGSPSLTVVSLDQIGISSPKPVARTESENSSPGELKVKELESDSPESLGNHDVFVTSVRSPYRTQHLPDSLGILKFGSPDKLIGDLNLFNSSLVFTAEQLSRAPAEVIGASCHGTLYRAALESGHMLIVRRLKEGIAKGRKEFSREAKKLGSIRHPRLVSLQGYYWGPKEHEKLIISNYIDAPCLSRYLQGSERSPSPPLSVENRLKIATDVASCLEYLHNNIAIPHGNLKSTNILFDANQANAFLTDYSLHRLMTPAGTAEQILNAGALGYLPPEFSNSSKPSPSLKSDVYAFGVILLELLTGRSSGDIVSANQGVVDLTDWVKMLVREDRTNECFDETMTSTDSTESRSTMLESMLEVALRCILPASERPDMGTILRELSSIVL